MIITKLSQSALKKEGRLKCVLFYACKGRIKDSGCIDMLFRDMLVLFGITCYATLKWN